MENLLKKIVISCLAFLFTLSVIHVIVSSPEPFLEQSEVSNSLVMFSQPPTPESPDFAKDTAMFWQTRSLQGTDRWKQASFDANIHKNWTRFFEESFGLVLDKKATPITYNLIRKIRVDSENAVTLAKQKYTQTRPYVYLNQPKGSTCLPEVEEFLKKNSSFPSGHTSLGWLMALTLAEISPERQEAILARGLQYGESRVICGFHWASDIAPARDLASAVFSRLHDHPEFLDMLAKAKEEIKLLRAKKS
ncbi:MAG: phosphatase PAP2 family protein [Deltaproteobacteria bacterium]|nr:phosphatase PAP2 family protein [Deltaproteobacteria bacterium]